MPDDCEDLFNPSTPAYDPVRVRLIDLEYGDTYTGSMRQERCVYARFVYRPGMDDLEPAGGLGYFLVAIGVSDDPERGWRGANHIPLMCASVPRNARMTECEFSVDKPAFFVYYTPVR